MSHKSRLEAGFAFQKEPFLAGYARRGSYLAHSCLRMSAYSPRPPLSGSTMM
jgi:hypothetical protein